MKSNSPSKSPTRKSQIPTRKKKQEVPKSEEKEFKMMTFAISTLFNGGFDEVQIQPSKHFSEITPKEYNSTFAAKVKECRKICDFSIAIKDQQSKKVKTDLLKDICEAFDDPNILHMITPQSLEKYYKMVTRNICRTFPIIKPISPFDCGDNYQETAWPHLFLVYKTLNTLLESSVTPVINNNNLVSALVSNCCGPDDRERFATKDILRKLYSKCTDLQPTIRRIVVSQFQTKICSPDLLEFWNKVVTGFQAPLSEEQIMIFKNAVIVLHSSPNFLKFCLNLLQCINLYIKLEPSLYAPTIDYIVTHWPSSHIKKQILMLSELEGLFLGFPKLLNEKSSKQVLTLLASLVGQPNIDLAETAANVIIGPAMEEPLLTYPSLAHKILDAQLLDVARNHWNEFVREDATISLQLMNELDKDLFESTLSNAKQEKKKKKAYTVMWRNNWAKVFESAKSLDSSIQGPNLGQFL